MTLDFNALGQEAITESNVDMTKSQAGGGDYEPPKAGFCFLRLVSYVEVGKHAGTFQGAPTLKPYVQMVVEVSGPNHPPGKDANGKDVPIRVTIEEPYSLNEKAKFFKLVQRLLYKGDKKHVVQCIGEGYKAKLLHRTYKGRDGKDRVAVEFWDKANAQWTIEAPRSEIIDPDTGIPTGEWRVLKVPPMISEGKAFLWDANEKHLKAMWDSLYIPGEYPERKNDKGEVIKPKQSKNVLQNKIKAAVNFKGSPIYNLLLANGTDLGLPDAGVDMDEEAAPFDGGSKVLDDEAALAQGPVGSDDALGGIV